MAVIALRSTLGLLKLAIVVVQVARHARFGDQHRVAIGTGSPGKRDAVVFVIAGRLAMAALAGSLTMRADQREVGGVVVEA